MGDAFLIQNIKKTIESQLGLIQSEPATSAIQLRDLGYSSGVYWINWGGTAREIYCEMTLEGGGWMMILNYNRGVTTNPNLNIRTNNFPLMGAQYTYTNETGSTGAGGTWGHISNILANQYPWTEYMFYGKKASHSRIVHFRGNNANIVSYIKTGSGKMEPFHRDTSTNFNGSLRVNASMPLNLSTSEGFNNQGNLAMTNFPMYGNSNIGNPRSHWGIRGSDTRWEADDSDTSNHNTIHRVWVR